LRNLGTSFTGEEGMPPRKGKRRRLRTNVEQEGGGAPGQSSKSFGGPLGEKEGTNPGKKEGGGRALHTAGMVGK